MGKLYGAAPMDDVRLARQAQPYVESLQGVLPDGPHLQMLTSEHGTDFASAVFYHAIKAVPQHKQFIKQVNKQPIMETSDPAGIKLFVIPAFFYREYPEVGGGGQHIVEVARACGIDAQIVAINSVGSVSSNINVIREILLEAVGNEIWLLSMSKGSAEIRLLLQNYSDALPLEDIRVWFNIGGLANGCDLVDHMLSTPMRRLKTRAICAATGADYAAMEELRTDQPYWQIPLSVPEHLQIINIFGVPLLSHLQRALLARYHRLKNLGPNDGMVLLSKAYLPLGPIYPLWGADHFMRDARVVPLLYRLFGLLLSPTYNTDTTNRISTGN